MRLRVDDISFEVPRGLEDRTSYRFVARAPREELELSFEFPSGGGTPSAELIAAVRERLDGLPIGRLSIDEQGERELAGVPGHDLRFSCDDDDGARAIGYVAVANLGSARNEADWVKFSWMLTLPLEQARAHIDAVLASVAPLDAPPPAATPPDWVRRRAGRWAFDLPARLEPPRDFRWVDVDAGISLTIHVHELGEDEPELDAPLVEAADAGYVVLEREEVEPELEHARDGAAVLHLAVRDEELERELHVSRAVLGYDFGDPPQTCWVELDARGPRTAADRVRELVDALLASLAKEDGP